MGAATDQALAAAKAALSSAASVDLDAARELFAAARVLADSSQLSGALADPAASTAARGRVVTDVFGKVFGATTLNLLTTTVEQRWSSAADLIDGIEELAVRAAVRATPGTDVEAELFGVSRIVAAHPELELALGSRLGDSAAKGALVTSLLEGRTSETTTLVVSQLVQQPRERRIRQLLTRAMRIAADQRGTIVATAYSAVALSPEQVARLEAALSAKYGTTVSLNPVIDPTLVGGLRVQIADDVIDGSVSSRLADLRNRLAG